jgi:hypothetical protein
MIFYAYVLVLVLSVLFVFATVFLPITVYSPTDLLAVHIGWPLAFIIQNQRPYAPSFPWQTHLYSVWENQIQILWLQLFLDIAIVFGVTSLATNYLVVLVKTNKR